MFQDRRFRLYTFDDIPIGRDAYLMSEKYALAFEEAWASDVPSGNMGAAAHIGVVSIGSASAELAWYPDLEARYHEVPVTLPRSEFVYCVSVPDFNDHPVVFVRHAWLKALHERTHSAFALVDAINVRAAIAGGHLTRARLIGYRNAIDELALKYPHAAFISWADSLIIKTNWKAGYHDDDIARVSDYHPEELIHLVDEVRRVFVRTLGVEAYAVLTQGTNEFYDDELLHVAQAGQHVCLNTIGVPFAELFSIDQSVRHNIHERIHPPSELYMDSRYCHSLRYRAGYQIQFQSFPYVSKMTTKASKYYATSRLDVISKLQA